MRRERGQRHDSCRKETWLPVIGRMCNPSNYSPHLIRTSNHRSPWWANLISVEFVEFVVPVVVLPPVALPELLILKDIRWFFPVGHETGEIPCGDVFVLYSY